MTTYRQCWIIVLYIRIVRVLQGPQFQVPAGGSSDDLAGSSINNETHEIGPDDLEITATQETSASEHRL